MKIIQYIMVGLLMMACTSDNDVVEELVAPPSQENKQDITLLIGRWVFTYATNSMIGERSYTFRPDSTFLYADEWNTFDTNNGLGQPFSVIKEGDFSLPVYKLTSENSAEGTIIIDGKQMDFNITTTSDNLINLYLVGDEWYTKEIKQTML